MDVNNGVAKAAPIFDKDQILQYAIANGILDLPDIEAQIEMNTRKKYLDMHTHTKWQSTDGDWCTYLPDDNKPKKRRLIKRKLEKDIDNAIIKYWKELEENPTVGEIFTEWNDRRLQRGQIKKSTHSRNIEMFNRFYKDFMHRKIGDISENDWEDFLCDIICEFKMTAKSFANIKSITKGFLKRAKKRGLISMNVETFMLELDISDSDFKREVIDEEKEVFFDDEVEKIMSYIKKNQDIRNIGIALMFVTGIRVGELVALKHEDFDGTIFKIKRTETRFRKDDKSYQYEINEFPKTPAGYRTVFVPKDQKWIVDKIRLMNPFGDFIFVNEDGSRINTDMMRRRLWQICDKIKIPRRSPHKIRKTYGSILLDNNIDRKTIEGQMGHTDITCTEKYYHRNRKHIDEKQNIFDNIPEFMAK